VGYGGPDFMLRQDWVGSQAGAGGAIYMDRGAMMWPLQVKQLSQQGGGKAKGKGNKKDKGGSGEAAVWDTAVVLSHFDAHYRPQQQEESDGQTVDDWAAVDPSAMSRKQQRAATKKGKKMGGGGGGKEGGGGASEVEQEAVLGRLMYDATRAGQSLNDFNREYVGRCSCCCCSGCCSGCCAEALALAAAAAAASRANRVALTGTRPRASALRR